MQRYEILNHDEMEKLREDLKGWTDYIPLELLSFKESGYWQKCTREAKRKNIEKRQGIGTKFNSIDEYLLNDMLEWVEEYPQFKYIINWEKLEEHESG